MNWEDKADTYWLNYRSNHSDWLPKKDVNLTKGKQVRDELLNTYRDYTGVLNIDGTDIEFINGFHYYKNNNNQNMVWLISDAISRGIEQKQSIVIDGQDILASYKNMEVNNVVK